MKFLFWKIGCPKALFHCQHELGTRTLTEKKSYAPLGCRRPPYVTERKVSEKRWECCKCDWSDWREEPHWSY